MAKPVNAIVNGPSAPIQIESEDSMSTVAIGASSWDPGTTVALEGKTSNGSHWAPVEQNGVPIVATANRLFIIEGNGYLRMNVSNIGTTTGLELSID